METLGLEIKGDSETLWEFIETLGKVGTCPDKQNQALGEGVGDDGGSLLRKFCLECKYLYVFFNLLWIIKSHNLSQIKAFSTAFEDR